MWKQYISQVDVSLQEQCQKFVDEIGKDTQLFMELLDSKEKIASYFMDWKKEWYARNYKNGRWKVLHFISIWIL